LDAIGSVVGIGSISCIQLTPGLKAPDFNIEPILVYEVEKAVSFFAFKLNLYRYTLGDDGRGGAVGPDHGGGASTQQQPRGSLGGSRARTAAAQYRLHPYSGGFGFLFLVGVCKQE
jgi:hypothetical protein